MPTATLKERIDEWREENPQRRWRHKEGLAMMDVAVITGLAFSSVQQHEQGGYVPSEDSMYLIADMMGIEHAKLERQWRSWYDRKPS